MKTTITSFLAEVTILINVCCSNDEDSSEETSKIDLINDTFPDQ